MDMNAVTSIETYASFPVERFCASADSFKIETALQKDTLDIEDFLVLLSDTADRYLEEMALKAASITRNHFGNVITLFTPFYISNYCQNSCVYCSFADNYTISRRQLSTEEICSEAEAISKTGMRHVLVLTGEAPDRTTFDYIRESLSVLASSFSAVGIEVYPLQENQYRILITESLIDSLTIYQETYNRKLYRELHTKGPKSDYCFRLETPDRACSQNIRALTIGALFGLDDYRKEALALAVHMMYLQKMYPHVELSVSFPRIRPLVADFKPRYPVSDRQLVQIITAFRIMFPRIGITLSTRESAAFRNGVMPLGITRVSAGVSTAVGGHTANQSTAQFEIADQRNLDDMMHYLTVAGFQPVLHDWNQCMNVC